MVCVAVIVTGWLSYIYDKHFGVRDNVIYLWPMLVMLLMAIAACVLLCQAGAFMVRVLQRFFG
jgi:hypothetical protein